MDNNAPTGTYRCCCKCHESKPRRITGTIENSNKLFYTLNSGGSPSVFPHIATISSVAPMPFIKLG